MTIRAADRMGVAEIVALVLASLTLGPLTVDGSYRLSSWIAVIIVCGLGIVARRLRLPFFVIATLQTAVVAVFLGALSLGLGNPDLSPLARVGHLYASAIRHIRTESAPMPAHPGVTLLFVTFVAVLAIVTDMLAQTLDQAEWTIAPLGTLYLIPALGPRLDTSIGSFLLLAIAYLIILLADGINANHVWSRNLSEDSARRNAADAAAARVAAAIGIPALIVTFILGLVVPRLDPFRWDGTRPNGSGPIQLSDPSLDIRRNLNQPDDSVILTYQTDQSDGIQLRMAVLPVFDHNGFHISSMSVKTGALPPPTGVTRTSGLTKRTTNVQIGDYRTEYLPLPYAPSGFDAKGQWGYDSTSLVVISTAANGREATRNLNYKVTSLDIVPDGTALSSAKAGNPPDRQLTAAVPTDLPSSVTDLALDVTKDASTPALKAAAIQEYLRSKRFTYSTRTLPGSGYEALENFLLRDRTGYCEQFATAMAAMARVVGIPSRVAVGFLPGERNTDGTWEVSKHDQHAWPELYFEGQGWVRFEPTPGSVTGAPPAWTVVGESDAKPSATATSKKPTTESSTSPSPSPSPTTAEQDTTSTGPSFDIGKILGIVGGIGGGIFLLLLPALIRWRLRVRRLAGHQDDHALVADAWAEVRDTVRDTGHAWPGGSPREIATTIADLLPDEQQASMDVIATQVERSRYARTIGHVGSLATEVNDVRHALLADLSRTDHVKALLAPRSLWANLKAWAAGLRRPGR